MTDDFEKEARECLRENCVDYKQRPDIVDNIATALRKQYERGRDHAYAQVDLGVYGKKRYQKDLLRGAEIAEGMKETIEVDSYDDGKIGVELIAEAIRREVEGSKDNGR